MLFDYRTLFGQLRRSLFGTHGTNLRLTPRRLRFFAIFLVLFISRQFATRIFLALDHIFYPGFRKVDLTGKTLFIVGNFRSGSTFLHRMLAADENTFTALATWEIYLAPSILERKMLYGLREVDRWFGAPLYEGLRRWDRDFLQKVPLHSVSLWKPEEDVGLLLYIWYGLFSWFFFPDWTPIEPLIRFDNRIPAPRRRRIIGFYADCLRRHLYVHGTDRIVVSKNPSFSPLIESLRSYLPGARFIGLVRHPVDTVASTLGWLSFAWHFFADPVERYPFSGDVIEMTLWWYACMIKADSLPDSVFRTLRFNVLVGNTVEAVRSLYEFVERKLPEQHLSFLVEEEERSRAHTPDGRANLDSMEIDPHWLSEVFHDTMSYYGFSEQEELQQIPGSKTDGRISPIRAVDKT